MSKFATLVRSNRWLAGAAALLMAPIAVVTVSALQAEAAVAPSAGSTYTLAVTNSGRCIDVVDGSTDNGGLLQQWGCHADQTNQQWKVNQVSTGVYSLSSVGSGKCIDVPTGAVAGTQLQQWNCGDATKTNQQFKFTASGTGTYSLASVRYGLCLSLKDSTANGAPLVVDTCATGTTQQWGFTLVSGGSSGTGGGATCPCTVASDGTGTYKTVQAAITAAASNSSTRQVITIKAGTYREIVTVPSTKTNITLQGAGSTSSGVVIVNNHSSAGGYGTSGSATFFASAAGFQASNLTISNDYGSGSQAVALQTNGDKQIYNNVRVLGFQDTLLTNTGRAYFVNSYIEGATDFIFGGSVAVFNASTIHNVSSTGGVMTAANTAAANTYGYLFYKCTVNNAGGTNVTTLGRPWGAAAQVLYRESTLSAGIKSTAPWQDMSSNSWKNARFFSYKNTGAGAATNSNTPQMSASTAANYTPQKYLAGSDGWNPL